MTEVETKVKKRKISRSTKAGLIFPVARIHRYLRRGNYAKRLSEDSSVYLAAVLEYLVAETIDVAGEICKKNHKKRISAQHIQLGIKSDGEFETLLDNVIIPWSGVVPSIHPHLLNKKSK